MRMQNWSAAVCLAVLMAGAVHADVTGSILGVVRDQSSAAIVAARIRVTNVETNLSKETLSGTDGEFRVLALPAGTYRGEHKCSWGAMRLGVLGRSGRQA